MLTESPRHISKETTRARAIFLSPVTTEKGGSHYFDSYHPLWINYLPHSRIGSSTKSELPLAIRNCIWLGAKCVLNPETEGQACSNKNEYERKNLFRANNQQELHLVVGQIRHGDSFSCTVSASTYSWRSAAGAVVIKATKSAISKSRTSPLSQPHSAEVPNRRDVK